MESLKIKETDRLIAIQNELQKFGASIEIKNDSELLIHLFNFYNICNGVMLPLKTNNNKITDFFLGYGEILALIIKYK